MTQLIHQTKNERSYTDAGQQLLPDDARGDDVSAQQKPTTGYAPNHGIHMYYEVHGGGEPVVLLHGAFMTITNTGTGGSASSPKRGK